MGHLFYSVCKFHFFEQAAHRAFGANRNAGDALQFMVHLKPERIRLERDLQDGVYNPGPYHTVTIREPRERRVEV